MNDKLRVSDVAIKLGISKRTIKYYEEIGILKSYREEGSNLKELSDIMQDLESVMMYNIKELVR